MAVWPCVVDGRAAVIFVAVCNVCVCVLCVCENETGRVCGAVCFAACGFTPPLHTAVGCGEQVLATSVFVVCVVCGCWREFCHVLHVQSFQTPSVPRDARRHCSIFSRRVRRPCVLLSSSRGYARVDSVSGFQMCNVGRRVCVCCGGSYYVLRVVPRRRRLCVCVCVILVLQVLQLSLLSLLHVSPRRVRAVVWARVSEERLPTVYKSASRRATAWLRLCCYLVVVVALPPSSSSSLLLVVVGVVARHRVQGAYAL